MKRAIRSFFTALAGAAAVLAAGTVTSPALAGGVQHNPNGLVDISSGVLPPPGLYWLNYLTYIEKDTIRDQKGDEPKGLELKAKVGAEVARFVWMTPVSFAGANYGAQVVLPLYMSDVSVKAGGTKVVDSDSKGLGDVTFDPCILAWHFNPNLHAAFGLDIIAPVGHYDKNDAATTILAKNHWTFEPVFAMSYWVPGGIDLSAKLMYDFHTKNTDPVGGAGEIKPGQEFHTDWALSYALGKEDMRLGLAGYYYVQTTDDKVDGVKDDSGLRARAAGLGGVFKWWPGMGRFSLTAKYLKDFAGQNVNEGQSFWINTTYAF